MTKVQLLQWMLNSCVGFIPIYFILDMVAVYGYLRLHYLGKRVYKSYLIASIILTLVLLVNCSNMGIIRVGLIEVLTSYFGELFRRW